MPLVSVIIPTYNRADLIQKTLDSVLAQTYPQIELIVVDDGSTDNTEQVVGEYDNGSVQYIRKANGGEASARNWGIRAAKGKYIACLDSDDLWQPLKLAHQVAALEQSQAAWVYCDAELFDGATGKVIGLYSQQHYPYQGSIAPKLLLDDFIACPSPLIRRDVFERVGYFNESNILRMRSDWEMWLRIAACYSVVYLSQALARYRVHAGSASQQEDVLKLHQSQVQVLEQALLYAPAVYGPVRQAAFTAQYIRTGRSLIGQGKSAEARKMFAQAIRSSPTQFQAYPFLLTTFLGQSSIKRLIALNRWRHNRQ
ncbi:MAG: glycosyltransferase [Caldilineaceae bacterium]|nr:glycosyltransferase [Caldilineaceae bacterium]